jgi:ATP-dependent Clp protease ATP-binding subunit ClpA
VQVQNFFKPELLNRLSEIVIFQPLARNVLKEIVKIQMKSVIAKALDMGISVSINDAALDVILSESYNPVSKSSFQDNCRVRVLFTGPWFFFLCFS